MHYSCFSMCFQTDSFATCNLVLDCRCFRRLWMWVLDDLILGTFLVWKSRSPFSLYCYCRVDETKCWCKWTLLLFPCLPLSLSGMDDISDSNCSRLRQPKCLLLPTLTFVFCSLMTDQKTGAHHTQLLLLYIIHPSICHPRSYCICSKPRQSLFYGRKLSKEAL